MDAFVSRKRRRISSHSPTRKATHSRPQCSDRNDADDDSTDFKLAVLASLHPELSEELLLDALLSCDGSTEMASEAISQSNENKRKNSRTSLSKSGVVGYQSSLASYRVGANGGVGKKPLTRRGKTLFLYSPDDIEANTPCSIIHHFLPPAEANALLLELLEDAPTYSNIEFQLFDRVVKSPHTFCFYVNSLAEAEAQKTEYLYDGRKIDDVRQSLPEMLKVSDKVEAAVNSEIQRRIRDFYPNGEKLKYQSPGPWKANTAFVNCYDGPNESVGYHSDQLTYLGPRAVIGSLSLGVAREFRIRKVVAEDDAHRKEDGTLADAQGQISIHLPHNSLLVMHAEMQEEWKHSIAPAQAIDPHPLAKNKRLNITYRSYKDHLHPRYTPKCRCGVSTVLRCVTRKKETRGRYMWMCHVNYVPGEEGCGFFQWAEFDADGNPPWVTKHDAVLDEIAKAKDQ
ncbi:hypothetical protein BU24DRAFT_415867 [Aaosphaeria arxii CBS 175.79]|uniref:Uncharacterized protein n=1 Tax=Aaosphaeria arxii CBS 175.79 TaxID=1450172 RepID=A0A6A5X6D3_9PLEO|nr:uncharacterized protein BU24DRAFT_415867 [Aaosphaeria arxii CBS 175.79]KAF2008509.1 hypothetical protein BU24DRAFT_415867 [Aaosphaeria arxii CBS 175.79]